MRRRKEKSAKGAQRPHSRFADPLPEHNVKMACFKAFLDNGHRLFFGLFRQRRLGKAAFLQMAAILRVPPAGERAISLYSP